MKKSLVLSLSLIVLAIVAVFLLTKQEKNQDILAKLDKTNYGANVGKGSGGITSLVTSILPFLL